MYDTGVICHECYGECVGAVFCGFGGSDTPDVRLPKTLNVVIEANAAFWGFGGTLFSGEVEYGSSSFDYWDNFDEDWLTDKTCQGGSVVRDLNNERRPDVQYRSVYDPDNGTTTYDGNTEIDAIGGPAVYLIDRDATKTTDGSSCDETDPADVFRHHPENFGFGNKILFEEDIYKNISAAWRGVDTGNPNFSPNVGGLPDGAIAGPYAGAFASSGIFRGSADPFIHFKATYNGGVASGISDGALLYVKDSPVTQIPDGAYYVAKATHQAGHTDCKIVGTVGTAEFTGVTTGASWTMANSYDEQTCYGRAAYGIDYDKKRASSVKNYHADLGVVINDSRNRIHSNREDRDKWGWSNTRNAEDQPRRDYNYVSVQESGHVLMVKPEDLTNQSVVCTSGIWDPTWDFIYTSGTDYYSSYQAKDIPNTGIADDLSTTYGSGTILGTVDINPLPAGWEQYVVASGMSPMHPRELSFYGPFYEVYEEDNAVRQWQQDNTIKGRNNTCYTKTATLEVFPDCITQEIEYEQCGGGDTYLRTNVSRLAFVYRCFDYPEPCAYDESGRPYGGAPSSVDDLRRGLAGQEVYMYLNMGDAWAGEINRDPCGCVDPPPGNLPPNMLTISSPVTFPCFLNFDNNPNAWGAEDQLWKRYAANFLGDSIPASSCPGPVEGDYGFAQQPYTTYGFIRNVCGKETNASKAVIQSLNDVNTGNYRETTPTDDTVEPMYWEFPPISPSGGIGGGWGEALTQTFVNDSGTYATWGIVDDNNRLVAPYYPVESGDQYDYCDPASVAVTYNKFDAQEAFRGNWPKDDVPFLISITHDNNCVGCGSTNMSAENTLTVTLESLDASYDHNKNGSTNWGHNYCGYDGEYAGERSYNCPSGTFNSGVPCRPNDIYLPHTGETCECATGSSYTLYPEYLEGTTIPKYWTTRRDDNPDNAFVYVDGCDVPISLTNENPDTYGGTEALMHAQITLSCNSAAFYGGLEYLYGYEYFGGNPLEAIYGCGGCSHSYPGVNGRPNLSIDWFAVSDENLAHFQNMTTEMIWNAHSADWLCQGPTASITAASMLGYSCTPPAPTAPYDPCGEDLNVINYRNGCVGNMSGVLFGSTDLPACDGSVINFYGCLHSHVDEPTPTATCSCNFFTSHFSDPAGGNNCVYASGNCAHQPDTNLDERNYDCATSSGCDGAYLTYNVGGATGVRQLPSEAQCGCNCIGQYDLLASMTFYDSYDFGGGTVLNDVWVVTEHNCPGSVLTVSNNCGATAPIVTAISGGQIPGIGDFGPIPNVGSIACYIGSTTPDPACIWKSDADPNNFVDVDYKIYEPGNADDKSPQDTPCGGLWPHYCDDQWGVCAGNSEVYRSTCGTPLLDSTTVSVRRKRAHPEIMTVHKIDCLGEGSGYNLHVSREYHTHSRNWRFPIDGYTCDFYQGAVRGGGYNWRLTDTSPNTENCPQFFYHPCSSDFASVFPAVDTGAPWNLEGPVPSYYLLPHSIPSDQVTPAWPTSGDSALSTSPSMCTQHPSSGSMPYYSVTRDFQQTIEPYRASHTEWIKMMESGGAVQAPLYTGIFSTPDTGVYGDYCDLTSNTGALVDIFIERGRTFLPASITDNLTSAGTSYTLEVGGLSCSGQTWAVSGEPLLQYDSNGYVRYFTEDTLAASQCDINQRYPDLSGVTLWNYYNLFYGSGDPDSKYFNYVDLLVPDEEGDCNDPGRQPVPWNFANQGSWTPSNLDNDHFGPLYEEADDIPLNRRHSCIQDSATCGGAIWNNKMFFPRKAYETDTRVTAFGALSLCTQDTRYETASWLEGYEDLSSNGPVTLLREANQTRFIDACDFDAHSVTLQSDCGIDDVIIHVDDYLPLLGMYFVDRKTNLGDWTCLQPESGCYDFLPIHSEQTLDVMSFTPAETWSANKNVSLGYHLDKLVTKASDECLFKPFKIMVDVDCCPDIMRKRGQEGDLYDPTYMQWIDTNAPALACQAWNATPSCDCQDTACGQYGAYEELYADGCVRHYAVYPVIEQSGDFCTGDSCADSGFWYATGVSSNCSDYQFITSNLSVGAPIEILVAPGGPELVDAGSGTFYELPTCDTCQLGYSGVDERCISNSKTDHPLYELCGVTFQLSTSGTVPGLLCGGNWYVDGNHGTLQCCTLEETPCALLQSSFKIPPGDCIIKGSGDGVLGNHLAEATGCDCFTRSHSYPYIVPGIECASTQNLLITISEE